MKILIIEDDIANADFLKTSFESESFIVDVAHDGERGTYLARTSGYDIMIIDNVLPKKMGLEVCREIRDAGKTAPIIILSVKTEIPGKVELLNAGADDYVLKPYSFNELLARVWARLRRMNTIESPRIRIGSLVIDTIAQEVKNGDTLIYLTRKEFLLLELLMKQHDTVVTRG
ncbi:DNA-binding response regulator, partial [bacterium]|nr:DNA-binding response regulator [bacterium]